MPYVKREAQENLLRGYVRPDTAGELNFLLTHAVVEYVRRHGVSYCTINDVLGAFEGAKLDFYRRIATPYEERKRAENGDVYPMAEFGL